MIAIAFFAGAEFMSNTAIVEQTPWMFTEGPLSNAGTLGGLLEQVHMLKTQLTTKYAVKNDYRADF